MRPMTSMRVDYLRFLNAFLALLLATSSTAAIRPGIVVQPSCGKQALHESSQMSLLIRDEQRNAEAESIPVFEQYGFISPDLENAILDNFAIQLLHDPQLRGYVVLRRGGYSSRFAAQKLRRIKKYLVNRRRVPASRVSAFEGKRSDDFTVELYLLTKGKAGPVQGSNR